MFEIDKMPKSIDIGYTGETCFRDIKIDMSAWMEKMPEGIPSIILIRPWETAEDAYIAATTFEDNILTWVITDADLGTQEGEGLMQIWLEEEENNSISKRGKSIKVTTRVVEAADDPAEDPPAAQQAWITQMTALKVATVNAAEEIKAAVAHNPTISETTGNWLVWDAQTEQYIDTGVHAEGQQGEPGDPTEIIDDDAGTGDTDKVWSANKSDSELSDVKSAINGKADLKDSSKTGVDLDVSDPQGNVIVRIANGHIKTKNFDSNNISADIVQNSSKSGVDFDISDESGNVILRLSNGGIKTKKFDSTMLATKTIYPSDFVSRLKPNVYRIGKKYLTDFDITAHKLTGAGEVWVDAGASSGGTGTESSPYNNINTAISSDATTIYLKSGMYILNTHFNTQVNIAGKNIIGLGNVVLDCSTANNCPFRCWNGSGYLENVEIKGGTYAFNTIMSDTDTMYLYKVRMHDTTNNALDVLGGNVYAVECVAYNAGYDGFNYHANDSYIPNVVEVDCVAYDCGDGTRDSDNGSTIHDGASIVRIGGEYYRCHGGVVADKGYDSTKPCYSVNFGVYAHDSTHAIANNDSFKASFWAQTYTMMWLFDCKASGSMYEISSTDHAEVFCANLMSENMFDPSDYTATGGTINRIGGV